MFRNIAFAAIYVAVLVFLTAALARSADYGTAEEARATLDKAVAAVKADKAKALEHDMTDLLKQMNSGGRNSLVVASEYLEIVITRR